MPPAAETHLGPYQIRALLGAGQFFYTSAVTRVPAETVHPLADVVRWQRRIP